MKNAIKTLLTTFKHSPKQLKVTLGAVLATVFVGSAVVFAGWTPERPVYNWSAGERTGSTNGPRMNAWIGTPYYGDERAFFDARRADTTGAFHDVLANPSQGSKEVILRTYVHNGANQSTNNSGGKATGAKVRVDLPTGTSNALRARSYISISNPAPGYPGEVTDTTELVDNLPFRVRYKPGTARLFNAVHNGIKLSDDIVTTGAPIGYDQMNGEFPGCFEFQAFVEIIVQIETADTSIEKQVRKAGESTWQETVQAKPGENVQWTMVVMNTGQMVLNDVVVRDVLPPHLKLVPGSVKLYTASAPNGLVQPDTPMFSGGLKFGNYAPGGGLRVRFDTTALDDFQGCSVTLRNLAYTKSNENPNEKVDFADVKITKENCQPPVVNFACDGLDAQNVNRTNFRFTARGSAQNTNITGWIFKVNGTTKQDSESAIFNFAESNPGTYTVTAQLKTGAGTTNVTELCTKKVTVEQPPAQPKFSCDLLEGILPDNSKPREYILRTTTTAEGGATVRRYFYNFGDNTPELVTDKKEVPHTYPEQGEFATTVKVEFAVGDKLETVTSDKCRVIIKTTKPAVLAAQTLPSTGPGEVIGIFMATTFAGAIAHRTVWARFRP